MMYILSTLQKKNIDNQILKQAFEATVKKRGTEEIMRNYKPILDTVINRYPVFGRAFTKDLIKSTKLYLPVNEAGTPDYKFMEDYIKSLPFSCKLK